MKIFGMIALLSVVTACGGSGGGGQSKGKTLDPLTQDKFEEAIRSLAPGMVTIETSVGSTYNLDRDENGKYSAKVESDNTTTEETVLKVDGDDLYTLVVETDDDNGEVDRHVKKESREKLVRNYSEPLPKGFTISISGNKLSVAGTMTDDWEVEPGTKLVSSFTMNMSMNLDDIRCSSRSKTTSSGKLIQDGKTTKLPNTVSTDITGCGRTLTRTELRALDLSNISLCDETAGDEDVNCEGNQDLRHLVQ